MLQSPQNSILELITGVRIDRWLNVEFPEVQQTRVDLLGETANGRLISFELQSFNDLLIPLRMGEYALRVYRLYKRFPEQYVLYVGEPKLSMPSELVGPDFLCRFKIVDVRMLDEETLLQSPFDADNILAILTMHKDRRETIRRILERIAKLDGTARDSAVKKLMILAGLRRLGDSIRKEMKQMPILDDIMDHDVIVPAIRQGIAQGRQEGFREGELNVLRLQIKKRFGNRPSWVDERLSRLSTEELEALSLRLLDSKSLSELFQD